MSGSLSFLDSKNREWNVKITLGDAMRLEKSDFSALTQQKISFLKPEKQTLGIVMGQDPLLFAVIWVLVQPQVRKYFLDGKFECDPTKDQDSAQMEFVSSIDGNAISEGRRAMWEALQDFFHDHRIALSTLRSQMNKATDKLNKKLEEMSPKIEEMINEQLDLESENLLSGISRGLNNSA